MAAGVRGVGNQATSGRRAATCVNGASNSPRAIRCVSESCPARSELSMSAKYEAGMAPPEVSSADCPIHDGMRSRSSFTPSDPCDHTDVGGAGGSMPSRRAWRTDWSAMPPTMSTASEPLASE